MVGAVIRFEVEGSPIGKGRARATVAQTKTGQVIRSANGRAVIRHYTPDKTASWESTVRAAAKRAMTGRAPLDAPVQIEIVACIQTPASWPIWRKDAAERGEIVPTTKPDADNITKEIKDALNGIVWGDDVQVIELTAQEWRVVAAVLAAPTSRILRGNCSPASRPGFPAQADDGALTER